VLWEQNLTIKEVGLKANVTDVYLYEKALLVACRDLALYGFDRRTGDRLWVVLLPAPFNFAPTLFDGDFFGICGANLVRIDKNGELTIGDKVQVSVSAPFVMTAEYLYAAGSDGGIYKLDRQRLLPIWPAPARTGGAILSRLGTLGAYVVFGNNAGEIVGIDNVTGGRHINYQARGSISGVSTDADCIYAGSIDFYVYCVTLNNALKWKTIVQGQVTNPPVVSADRLYLDPIGAGVVALAKEDGNELWRNRDAQVFLADGRGWVFATGGDRDLLTIEAAKGVTIERLDISLFPFLPVNEFNDGLVYLVSPQGRIVCVTAQ
jgi:outer membrane protein assembly factor BamB